MLSEREEKLENALRNAIETMFHPCDTSCESLCNSLRNSPWCTWEKDDSFKCNTCPTTEDLMEFFKHHAGII